MLARTEAEADQARYDLKRIGRSESSSTDYALRVPHLKEAKANLKAAQADLSIARLQLKRTQVVAPFDGRVISKQVDVGQYVSPGMSVAEIYSTEMAEVRLPLTQSQVSLINIPSMYLQSEQSEASEVSLSTNFAGKDWSWLGKVVRTEGIIDAKNRLVYVVVEINHQQNDTINSQRPALTAGMFVKAEIKGKQINNIFVLPRRVLRYGQEIWLADENDQLIKQPVNVLYKDNQFVYINKGLQAKQRVITSALDYPVQGMKLSVTEAAFGQVQEAAK